MLKATLIGVIAITTLLFISPAKAWVWPSFYVIKSIARSHEALNSGKFKHRITVYKSNGEVARLFTENLSMSDPDRVSVKLMDDAGAEIAVHSRRLGAARAGEILRPVLYDLLFVKDRSSVFDHFKSLGLPLKTEADLYSDRGDGSLPFNPEPYTSFQRFEGKVAIAIGEKTSPAQLWVEKGSFLPLRAIVPAPGTPQGALEYRFMNGYLPYKTFWYPRTVSVFNGTELWLKIDTLEVRFNEPSTLESAKAKPDLSGEVQEFAEKYFKWVR